MSQQNLSDTLQQYLTLRNRVVQMKFDGNDEAQVQDFRLLIEELNSAWDKLTKADVLAVKQYEEQQR